MGLSVDPGSASGGAIACREDGSLGQGHAEKMLHFSLSPELLSAGQGCNPVWGRLANAELSCPSLMIR